MEYQHVGKSGLLVSRIGLGTNAFGGRADERTAEDILMTAIDHGVTLIDTANLYTGGASETIIGRALQGKRHHVILATKAGLPMGPNPDDFGSSRHHILREVEESLHRLNTDYIDLYQIHTYDPYTPLDETLRALDTLVVSGKVRYIGASNYRAFEFQRALDRSEVLGVEPYISIQSSYSLADRGLEHEVIPMALQSGIGIIAYYPLAGGLLTGKYRKESEPPQGSRADRDPGYRARLDRARLDLAKGIRALAESIGASTGALALAWLLTRSEITSVIAGATKVGQLTQNLEALDLELAPDTRRELDRLSEDFVWAPPFARYRLD